MALIELPRKWSGENHGVVVETANIGQMWVTQVANSHFRGPF